MALSYLPVDRHQQFLLPENMGDWLSPGHLVWFVLAVVERLDTAPLHARHPNNGVGRRAYDPEMLLALLLYAYCTGVRSSRQIERRCETDVAFRVLCANKTPDHTTIARFRQHHGPEAVRLFTDVLVLCAESGLASVGVVAVDGTKVGANASLAANRTRAAIESEVTAMLAEAEAIDSAENDLFGERRGDELPNELVDPTSRRQRLDAALRQLEAARQAEAAVGADWAERRDQAAAAGQLPSGRPPKGAEVAAAEAAVATQDALVAGKARQRQALEAEAKAKGHKVRGRPPKPGETQGQRRARKALSRAKAKAAAAARERERREKANTTDPDSRIMKTAKGWVQGYNAQAAVNEHGVVIAAELTQDGNDVGQCGPMMAAIAGTLDALGTHDKVGLLLFDAGYLSKDNLTADGPQRLIATGKARAVDTAMRVTGEPPPDATPLEAMQHRLRTPAGRSTYKLRAQLVEPYFGIVKDARGFRRFMRRGIDNVTAEWRLIAATHNLLKLFAAPPAPA